MSKGNMLLGHARGKVGDLVFSRSNGQQVVRARAAVVKNPQTEKQMIQRIILATVAQAYSRMSAICDHSFEGVQQGQKSMSVFLRKNLDLLRTKIANELASGGELNNVVSFSPIGSNLFAVNDFIISTGSLPAVNVSFASGTAARVAVAGTSYGDVIEALGLQRGDQLTFVGVVGNQPENLQFRYVRVILDPRDANDAALPLSTPFITDGAVSSPNPRNEGSFGSLSLADGSLTFTLAADGVGLDAAAVIVSRQNSDGTYKRSNATLLSNEVSASYSGYTMQEALDLFRSGAFDTDSELYLNNAGVGRTASNSEVAPITVVGPGSHDVVITGIVTDGDIPKAVGADGSQYFIEVNAGTSSEDPMNSFILRKKSGQRAQANTNENDKNEIVNANAAFINPYPTSDFREWAMNSVQLDFTVGTANANWLLANGISRTVLYTPDA